MRILIFTPTTTRFNPKIIPSLMNQKGVEFFDLMLTRDNPFEYVRGEVTKNIQLNYEKMRQTVLNQGYSKVWIVEEDMIVPEDALQKLLETKSPIATGLYLLRHGEPTTNIFTYHEKVRALGNNMRLADMKKEWGKTLRVTGGAMGCLLVDRSALDFSFELDKRMAPDIPFMVHCAEKGIETTARMDVVCGHERPNGEVLWPDETLGCRIERN